MDLSKINSDDFFDEANGTGDDTDEEMPSLNQVDNQMDAGDEEEDENDEEDSEDSEDSEDEALLVEEINRLQDEVCCLNPCFFCICWLMLTHVCFYF